MAGCQSRSDRLGGERASDQANYVEGQGDDEHFQHELPSQTPASDAGHQCHADLVVTLGRPCARQHDDEQKHAAHAGQYGRIGPRPRGQLVQRLQRGGVGLQRGGGHGVTLGGQLGLLEVGDQGPVCGGAVDVKRHVQVGHFPAGGVLVDALRVESGLGEGRIGGEDRVLAVAGGRHRIVDGGSGRVPVDAAHLEFGRGRGIRGGRHLERVAHLQAVGGGERLRHQCAGGVRVGGLVVVAQVLAVHDFEGTEVAGRGGVLGPERPPDEPSAGRIVSGRAQRTAVEGLQVAVHARRRGLGEREVQRADGRLDERGVLVVGGPRHVMPGGGLIGSGDLLPRSRSRANGQRGLLLIVRGGVCVGIFLNDGQSGDCAEGDRQGDERGQSRTSFRTCQGPPGVAEDEHVITSPVLLSRTDQYGFNYCCV